MTDRPQSTPPLSVETGAYSYQRAPTTSAGASFPPSPTGADAGTGQATPAETAIRPGDLVIVESDPGAAYVVKRLDMVGDVPVAVFVDGQGWWRLSALEKVA